MDELVHQLSQGEHPIIAMRAQQSPALLKDSIDRGFVLLKFTDTRGGTELGVRLDSPQCDVSRADFARGQGEVTLVGHLTLNGDRVRCVATVDVATCEGSGHLEPA
jgi:hypothetical protein